MTKIQNISDVAFGGRVIYLIVGKFEVGGSTYTGAWDDNSNYDVNIIGAHFMANTKLADFYGEYSTASSENSPDPDGIEVKDGEMSGYFVQVSRLFNKKYRPTLRYGELDYLDPGMLLGRSPTNMQLAELVFGFAYYPAADVVF